HLDGPDPPGQPRRLHPPQLPRYRPGHLHRLPQGHRPPAAGHDRHPAGGPGRSGRSDHGPAVPALTPSSPGRQRCLRAGRRENMGTMSEERIIGGGATREDAAIEASIRPQRLDDYLGQQPVREQMAIYIEAAKRRGEAMDHVLIFGPPGLGKTTLSHVIANELGVSLRTTSGPVIEKAGDLAALLTNLQPHDVLFIDEIHRLSPVVEEVLYPAMEDFQIDIMIGEGPAARSIKLDLPPFTLIGATTRAGL